MHHRRACAILLPLLIAEILTPPASGYVLRGQWVERVGTVDTVIPTIGGVQGITLLPGSSHRFRIQFAAFDDANGPAPAGGFIGWNAGTLNAPLGTNSRTPGRLSPFNFAPDPPGNGLPSTDPFTTLTSIDNTLGVQTLAWTGIPGGSDPGSPPPAVIRGLNRFVSTFEMTHVQNFNYGSIVASGHLLAASSWDIISSDPPAPGPDGIFGTPDDVPGSVTYGPLTLSPVSFEAPLNFIPIPSPTTAVPLALAATITSRRRRRA
jgi:hypothetical protein